MQQGHIHGASILPYAISVDLDDAERRLEARLVLVVLLVEAVAVRDVHERA